VLQSSILMMRHIGEREAADRMRNALDEVYRRKKDKLTKDVGGSAGTSEFADAVIEAMQQPVSATAG